MDRFEWLDCQAWLRPWGLDDPAQWLFQGFASFFVSPSLGECKEEEVGALSADASHLFFLSQKCPLDPAQLVFKLGVAPKESGDNARDVLLSFDESCTYSLDVKQVHSVTKWSKEKGCKNCRSTNDSIPNASIETSCTCCLLPPCLIVRLRHVNMIIYSRNHQSNGHDSSEIFGVIDLLTKELRKEGVPSNRDQVEERMMTNASQHTHEVGKLTSLSNNLLQKYLTHVDKISECATKAVNVCTADITWMSSLLHTMAQCVADCKGIPLQVKDLQHQLESCLELLEEEEQSHLRSLWSVNSTQHHDVRAATVESLRFTIEQKEQVRAAQLKLEILKTRYGSELMLLEMGHNS